MAALRKQRKMETTQRIGVYTYCFYCHFIITKCEGKIYNML